MIDCDEWKAEKRHESTNTGKLGTTRIMKASVPHVTSGEGRKKLQVS